MRLKMKTRTLKQILVIMLLATALLITNTGISKATLQANPNTQYTKKNSQTNWMTNFRQMEATGGAMGLNETLKSDLTPSSNSNNIDVHMMRTTEYGAIAILSASGYGNPSNSSAITTTTGNKTGVILNTTYYEWTAGGLYNRIFSGINSRYFDTYTDNTSARVGDALGNATTTNPGCAGWHAASESGWVSSYGYYFKRGIGGIFSFKNNQYFQDCDDYCRGVAVVGSGL